MRKPEIARKLRQKLPQLVHNIHDARVLTDAFLEILAEAVLAREAVVIPGFGELLPTIWPSRIGKVYNIKEKRHKPARLPQRYSVRFVLSPTLWKKLNDERRGPWRRRRKP